MDPNPFEHLNLTLFALLAGGKPTLLMAGSGFLLPFLSIYFLGDTLQRLFL